MSMKSRRNNKITTAYALEIFPKSVNQMENNWLYKWSSSDFDWPQPQSPVRKSWRWRGIQNGSRIEWVLIHRSVFCVNIARRHAWIKMQFNWNCPQNPVSWKFSKSANNLIYVPDSATCLKIILFWSTTREKKMIKKHWFSYMMKRWFCWTQLHHG